MLERPLVSQSSGHAIGAGDDDDASGGGIGTAAGASDGESKLRLFWTWRFSSSLTFFNRIWQNIHVMGEPYWKREHE
jgi:hypothetical protein